MPDRLLVCFMYQIGSLPQVHGRLRTGHVAEGFEEVYNADIWVDAKRTPKLRSAIEIHEGGLAREAVPFKAGRFCPG